MLGIVCGLDLEARILARHGDRGSARVIRAPGARAAAAALELIEGGATRLASFGFAGGLDPAVGPGTIVRPGRIIAGDDEWICDGDGALAGVDAPVLDVARKAALFAATGAAAVDMESHHVARAAREAGIPFQVVRVILDPAARAIPPAALAGMAPDGTTRVGAVVAALLRRPGDLPGLIRLAGDTRRARAALGRAAALLFAGDRVVRGVG